MQAASLSSASAGTNFPNRTMPASAAATGQPVPTPDVGQAAQDEDAARELRIVQLGQAFTSAYGMFEATGNLAHRDEAYRLLKLQENAIRARSARAQAARHAAFERQLDEGVGYFSSPAAQALAGRGGHS